MRALPVKDCEGIHLSILRVIARKYTCRLLTVINIKVSKSRQNDRVQPLQSKPIIIPLSPDKSMPSSDSQPQSVAPAV